jgi:8-oxo-dGTP pyrophosphatase MutT (NUDIX family)
MKQSYYDIVDELDEPTGAKASYDEVHRQGLRHRGVHVIIYTPDHQIVMQKRSPNLSYHPDEIEISVGGGVDTDELPEQAVVREIKEELGLTVRPEELKFIGKTKFNHRTKTQIKRVFIYNYSVCFPAERLRLQINSEETSVVFFISESKLRQALKVHRIKRIGKISSEYAYWKHLLDSI